MEKHLSRNLKSLLQHYKLTSTELARRCRIAQPVLQRLVVNQHPKVTSDQRPKMTTPPMLI